LSGPLANFGQLAVDLVDETAGAEPGKALSCGPELAFCGCVIAKAPKRLAVGELRLPEVERQPLLLQQFESLREALDRDVRAALGGPEVCLDQEACRPGVHILFGHASEREHRKLARIVETVLPDQDTDQDPVDLDHERSADLECKRNGRAQPLLGEREIGLCSRAESERAQVLQLEERVAGALEPVECLQAEPLRLAELAEVVVDETKLKCHACLVA
jgi:hypothetical protein